MREIRVPNHHKITFAIPFDEIADFLTEQDYEENKERKAVAVEMNFLYSPGDKDSGLDPSFSLDEWKPLAEYPSAVLDAIERYCDDLPQRYYDKAYENYCDHCDYLLYGDI